MAVHQRPVADFYVSVILQRLLLSICALIALLPVAGQSAPPPFIRVEGTRFMAGDQPFFFVGANLNTMHGPTARQGAAATIAAAAADGLRVGRLWALGEGLATDPPYKGKHYLFRLGPRGWQEQAYVQLDRVIAAAGKRGIRLVITLSNSWGDYGGIPMYLRWAGYRDVESYGYTDRFFVDPACRQWFAEHLERIVGRTNSITGVPYRNDPTIMAWELQNEMHGTPEAARDRERWTVEMARRVRRLDPNHLIVPGLIGYNLQLERRDWIRMNQLPEVSFCDQHIYPQEHLRSSGMQNLRRFIDDRVQLAHYVVGKPIIFGEFGFADRGPPAARARWHKHFLQRLFFDGGNGAMVWIYQPTLSWKRKFGVMIDRHRYRGLRRTLGRVARKVARRGAVNRNSALGAAVGDTPLAPTHAMMVRSRVPHRRWSALLKEPRPRRRLEIPVDRFSRAWFEEAGSWDGGILVHAYGRRTGWFEFLFRGPGFTPSKVEIRARMSSEYPGRHGPSHGFSQVSVLIDGVRVGERRVMPDNGVGEWYSVTVEDDKLLRSLRRGRHTLRFQVVEGPEANGVALFGRETVLNREPVEEPGPIKVIAWR